MLPKLTPDEKNRYARHLLLPEIGEAGQQRIKSGSALLVGVGGLGSPVALYLAAAGIGRLGIVDSDIVDESNLPRQVLYTTGDVGMPKVEAAAAHLTRINPHVRVIPFRERFEKSNAARLAADYDLLLDCSDNFPTRQLINETCVQLGKPEVFGAVYHFEGQVSVFDARSGPCYHCIFPNPPSGEISKAIFSPVPGVIGLLQAAEALKLLAGLTPTLQNRLALYDALQPTLEVIQLKKNPRCPVCGR